MKFHVSSTRRNVERVAVLASSIKTMLEAVYDILEWKDNLKSAVALVLYLIFVLNFRAWMIPLG